MTPAGDKVHPNKNPDLPPDDLREEWDAEDIESEDRKPDLSEIEDDTSRL